MAFVDVLSKAQRMLDGPSGMREASTKPNEHEHDADDLSALAKDTIY